MLFIVSNIKMNASNAFSEYMISHSVNRSINLSPTSGRLHRQREKGSFGPTICLMNRSREKNEESTAIEGKEEPHLTKILMLMLEIDRLGEVIKKLSSERDDKGSLERLREISFLKEQNQKLRVSVVRYETMQFDNQKRNNSEIASLREKIANYQAQVRTLTRKLKENQREMEETIMKGKVNQSLAERAKMEASRMEMSMHFNSTNIDLHKSVVRQKAMENECLREKVAKCEEIINDQKFLINGQRQELNRQRARLGQTEMKWRSQVQFLRKQLEVVNRQIVMNGQEESRRSQQLLNEKQAKICQLEEQIKDKCLIIANQIKTIGELDEKCIQLQRKQHDIEFTSHSKIIRAEQSIKLAQKQKERQAKKQSKQLQKYSEEIETLKSTIQQYKCAMMEKNSQLQQVAIQMNSKLKQKDQQVKRLSRRNIRNTDETKLNKSLSVDNSLVTNRLRASQVNLQNIVSSVMQLKNSNDRTTRIIGKSFSTAQELYYAK